MSMNESMLQFKRRARLPIVLQAEMAECGHACVAMISNFWGHNLDLQALRKINNPSQQGVNLLTIKDLFEHLGFITRAIRVPLTAMRQIKTPAILHWNMNHFVVLKKVKKDAIVIHDPAGGIRHCSMDEVSKSFTGIVLEVEKSDDFKKIQDNNKLTLYDFVRVAQGVKRFIGLLVLLSLSIEVLSLLNPLFMQYVTDDVIGSSNISNLYAIGWAFTLLILVQVFAEYIRGNMIIYLTNNLNEQFSSNVVRHLLRLPLEFFEKRHKGDIQSKFQSIDQIQKKISTDFVNVLLDGLMIIINLMVMMIYSRALTAVVVCSLLICFAIRYFSFYSLKNQMEASVVQHAKAATIFLETLQGIMPIKSFLKEKVRFNTWKNCYVQSLNADIKVARINVVYSVANQLLFHLEPIVVICMGVSLVLSSQFSVGMLIAFLSYRLMLVNKSASLLQNLVDYKLITIQLDRLSDLVMQEPELINCGVGCTKQMRGELTIEGVSFKYCDNDPNILSNLNVKIRAGEKVAIIGPSGSGKTTLLKIMMGLLVPTSGEVSIDAIPLNEFGLKNFRESTASVMQNDSLLSGSIVENIAFFDESICWDTVYDVAKKACIHDSIMQFKMGYETLVGDMGSTLSGGQKQRLLLARALYKKPKILFLDEATSHLDAANERAINNALKLLGVTQIIIAHRQETIQMADRIIDLGQL